MTYTDLLQLALTTWGLAIGIAAVLYTVFLGTVRVITRRGEEQ